MKHRMPPLVDHEAAERRRNKHADPHAGTDPAGDYFSRMIDAQAEANRKAMKADFVQRGKNWKSKAWRWCVRFVWRMVRKVMRKAWARRVVLAPFAICTATYFLSAIAYLMDRGCVTILGSFATGAPVVYWTLGGWAWIITRRRGLRPFSQRMWMAAAYTTVTLLALLTAAWRVGQPMPGLWGLAAVTFSIATAVFRHRERRAIPRDVRGPRQHKWEKIKKVKGTFLGPITDLGGGQVEGPDGEGPKRWVAEVDLTDTEMLVDDFAATAHHIAKRYRVGRGNVIVDEAIPGEDAIAKLTIVLENPLVKAVEFDETWLTMPEIGCFPFHIYSDGSVGLFRLWDPGSGTVNAFFSGDIGSGKSAGIFTAAIQACMTGRVHLIVGDPQGQSQPELDIVTRKQLGDDGYAGDAEQVYLQLVKLYAGMQARSDFLKTFVWRNKHGDINVGMRFFDQDLLASQQVDPEHGIYPVFWPIIVYVLEEAHKACKDPEYGSDIAKLLAMIIKLSRKTGIAVWAANQNPGIEELGNDSALRQNLIAGNVLCYRNSSKHTGIMILDGHMPEPHTIPKLTPKGKRTQGMVVASCPVTGSNRATISRSAFIERTTFWARQAEARVMPLDQVFLQAWDAADVERMEEQLSAEVTQYLKQKAEGGAPAEDVDDENPPWKKGKVPERCVAYLKHLELTTGFGESTTRIIAHEIGAALNTTSQALGRLARPKTSRKRPNPVPVVHSPRSGTWSLGPQPAEKKKELAGAAA